MTDGCDISSEIALRWTSLDLNDDRSTLVQVMAWCRQATSHFLSQCWPRSLPPYDVTRPQWVNLSLFLDYNLQWFSIIFTRGQFWPSGIVVACVCVCVCVCLSVNHELVRAIIHQPFKPGSPNLDQRCKRPWLRSLLFCGVIDGDLQGQIGLESQNLPHFWLVSLSGR